MGITFLEVKVSNPSKPENGRTFKFLVDSGAVYSVMPEDDLEELEVSPTSSEAFLLANGEKIGFLDVFSGTGTISFTEKTQPEYLFRTLLPQCVSIMARLP